MINIYDDVKPLETQAGNQFGLTEDIMIENAAFSLEQAVRAALPVPHGTVAIICGSGNNGADGYALARRLAQECSVTVIAVSAPK
ncbi:MAG: hypothetical protein IJ191_09345, partial [Treponema sp.]|nr:hypothetical protein [Treponema sp.]